MKVTNLSKTYPIKRGEAVRALKGVSFDLPDEGLVFILGKSGSGKSTLLNLLSGLDSADGGEIIVGGKNVAKMSQSELDAYRNGCCGFVFQEYNLIPELSVRDNVMLALELKDGKQTDRNISKTLDQVGLKGYDDRKVTELSGGQKQRIAIARAIIKSPEIIFADEPTGALDEKTGTEILELLKELSHERLVVVVTHDREYAEKYGDRIIELSDGEIISDSAKGFVYEKERQVEWRKPKLPIKAAVKVGCSNFKYHPIRLVFTILLSVIAFTLLGVSLTVALTDSLSPYVNAVYGGDIDYIPLYKYTYKRNADGSFVDGNNFFDYMTGNQFYYTDDASFKGDDLELIQSKTGMPISAIIGVDSNHLFYLRDFMPITTEEWNKIVPGLPECHSSSANIIYMDEAALKERDFALTGALPQAPDEIAINDCIFNAFKIAGFKDRETGAVREINCAEDIIGCKVTKSHNERDDYFTITGMVDTGCSKECARKHLSYDKNYPGLTQNDYHERVFVSRDYAEEFEGLLIPVGNRTDFRQFAEFVFNYENDGEIFEFNDVISKEYSRTLMVINVAKYSCLWLSAIFGVFAVILLINFIAASVRGQMKQIGIIRALGADFRSLCAVYGVSAAIICGIILALSVTSMPLGIYLVNALMLAEGVNLILFSFGALPVFLLLLIMVAACAAGCFAPLIKMKKLTPSQVISKGQIK